MLLQPQQRFVWVCTTPCTVGSHMETFSINMWCSDVGEEEGAEIFIFTFLPTA